MFSDSSYRVFSITKWAKLVVLNVAYLAQAQVDKKAEHANVLLNGFQSSPANRHLLSAVVTDEAHEEVRSFLLAKTTSSKVIITIN